jgi:hypothetical protein
LEELSRGLMDVLVRHLAGGTKIFNKNLKQESQCLGRGSNRAPPEDESKALPVDVLFATSRADSPTDKSIQDL